MTTLPDTPLIDATWDTLPRYVRAADTDGTLLAYLTAATTPADSVTDLLASGADMVDPAVTPSSRLDWVAALAGIDLTEVPDGDKRAFIASPLSRYRGNRLAIQQRVGLTLTGSKTVQIECPYEGDELAILVRTFTPETPDATATEAAVRAEVPAWLALTYETADGIDYTALEAMFTTYTDMQTNGGTYNDLSNRQAANTPATVAAVAAVPTPTVTTS